MTADEAGGGIAMLDAVNDPFVDTSSIAEGERRLRESS
jgi:hypothetical protein